MLCQAKMSKFCGKVGRIAIKYKNIFARKIYKIAFCSNVIMGRVRDKLLSELLAFSVNIHVFRQWTRPVFF